MPYLARAPLLLFCTAMTLPACSARTLDSDGTDSGTSDEQTSSTPGTTDAPPTTGAPTTGPNPTTMSPPDPSTTSTSTDPTTITGVTTSADPSMPGTTDDPTAPQKLDLPSTPANVPDGIWNGCTKVAPPGTAIEGESNLGPFVSTRAFFGYTEINGTLWDVRLLFLDDSADSELAFTELNDNFGITTGPAADIEPALKFTVENPFWVGTDPQATISVIAGGKTDTLPGSVTITGHQGSWDVKNPADPPRLQGSLGPVPGRLQLLGDFDAVFCDLLSTHIIAE